jgi:hypothetical protein
LKGKQIMAHDDWARPKPKSVDIHGILRRNPKHAHCDLTIHRSPKNDFFVGLYCCEHDHWFTWVNGYQTHYLEQLGIPNPQNCWSQQDKQDYEIQKQKNVEWSTDPWL